MLFISSTAVPKKSSAAAVDKVVFVVVAIDVCVSVFVYSIIKETTTTKIQKPTTSKQVQMLFDKCANMMLRALLIVCTTLVISARADVVDKIRDDPDLSQVSK